MGLYQDNFARMYLERQSDKNEHEGAAYDGSTQD